MGSPTLSGTVCLEVVAVHDGGARLVVRLLDDPYLMEGGHRGQHGAVDPHRYLLSEGTMIILLGFRAEISSCILTAMPGYMVVQLDNTMCHIGLCRCLIIVHDGTECS